MSILVRQSVLMAAPTNLVGYHVVCMTILLASRVRSGSFLEDVISLLLSLESGDNTRYRASRITLLNLLAVHKP